MPTDPELVIDLSGVDELEPYPDPYWALLCRVAETNPLAGAVVEGHITESEWVEVEMANPRSFWHRMLWREPVEVTLRRARAQMEEFARIRGD